MRIFAVSDLHADYRENRELLGKLPRRDFSEDALLVAGDIADRIEVIEDTLALLGSRFARVFYVPGNHELWVRDRRSDSIEKLFKILSACERLGVRTGPARAGEVWVVPLFSWYDERFAGGEEATDEELEGWADYHFCRWPESVPSVSEYMLGLNESRLRDYDSKVISMSHFIPRMDLLPEASKLRFKGLPWVAGSDGLETQLRRLQSVAHVFGHSHINRDVVIDGVRYVQNAMRYPRERSRAGFPLKIIWPPTGPDESTVWVE